MHNDMYIDRIYLHVGIYIYMCVCAYVYGVVLFEEASLGEFSGVFSRNTLQNDADLFDACILTT